LWASLLGGAPMLPTGAGHDAGIQAGVEALAAVLEDLGQ
jgi:hypothetical protein